MLSGEFISEFLACFMQNKIKYTRRPLQFGWEGAGREPGGSHPLALTEQAAGLMPALTHRQE